MRYVNLDGKCFSPVQNSKGGRVKSDTIFMFRQTAENFCATYSGGGVLDGHLIGRMTGPETAELIYHSRAANGNLEAGQARVKFINNENNAIDMAMTWQWMTGTQDSGTSYYTECEEPPHDRLS